MRLFCKIVERSKTHKDFYIYVPSVDKIPGYWAKVKCSLHEPVNNCPEPNQYSRGGLRDDKDGYIKMNVQGLHTFLTTTPPPSNRF